MASDDQLLFGEYLDEWLERRRPQLRPSTWQCYEQVVRCYLRPALGDQPVREATRRDLERLYARLVVGGGAGGRPLSTRTVQLTHAVIHRALEDALLDGLVDTNVAALARPPKHAPDEVELDDDLQVWTAEQTARFLAFVDDHPWRCLWHLALGTGGRRGELLGLRWQDVDLDAAQVRIRRSLTVVDGVARLLGTKTSRNRVLSVGVSVVHALRRQRDHQQRQRDAAPRWHDRWGLVMTTSDGSPVDPMDVTHEFRRLVRAADVPVIRLHDLRHTHASLLLEQRVPIKVVSERLGHATISMTMDVYAHLLPAMDSDAASRLDAAIHGLAP